MILSVLFCHAEDFAKVVFWDFVAQPKLEFSRIAGKNEKHETLEASIAIPPMQDVDFILEFKMNITHIGHYGKISIGLINSVSKGQNIWLQVYRSEFKNRAYFTAGVDSGLNSNVAPAYIGIKAEMYTVKIEYVASSALARWTISGEKGDLLHDTDWRKLPVQQNPDRFTIRAINSLEFGSSVVHYVPDTQNIFARSLIGMEGNIPYMLELYVDDVSISYGR